MGRNFRAYDRDFEDYARVDTSSVHEDTSEVQPSLEDDGIEQDTASTLGYLHTPHFSHRTMSPPPPPPSDPLPCHGNSFGYQTSYYASSEPSAELHGSTRDGYHYNRTNRELEDCQRRLERCRQDSRMLKKKDDEVIETLRVRLFHSVREAKKYDDAEILYRETVKKYDDAEKPIREIVTGKDPTKSGDAVILVLKHSFAGMLIEQEKFQEAEPISRAVWEKRKQCAGPPTEAFKECHRQLCSILCALGRHRDAENMHRRMYQGETLDEWALENGDEVCQRRREQGETRKAKETQDEVWKERLKQHGPRDSRTIRSGLCLIGFLEELVATIENQGSNDAEIRLSISHKQAFEIEIEVILRKIWDTRLHPEPMTDILDAGHKLGVVLLLQNKFSEAEAIFIPVWEGKKQRLGEKDGSTMSTGTVLGKALCQQGKRETYLRAVDILQGIWHVKQTTMKNDDVEVISSGEDVAQIYRSLSDWPNAEHAYEWIVHQKAQKRGCSPQEIEDARWNLGRALYMQGMDKNRKAEIVLGEMYRRWNASSPNAPLTLQCGQMLAQSLSTQNGRTNDALRVALDVFNARGASARKSLAYLESGHLYGSLLLGAEKFDEAEQVLTSLWAHQAEGIEEQKMRLRCGHLYGQVLAKRHKFPDAKKILDAVAAGQGAIIPAGFSEIAETRQLLEEVNRQGKEKKRSPRSKQNTHRRKGFAVFIGS